MSVYWPQLGMAWSLLHTFDMKLWPQKALLSATVFGWIALIGTTHFVASAQQRESLAKAAAADIILLENIHVVFRVKHARWATSMDELVPFGAQTIDPWGTRYVYIPGDKPSFRSAGPDRRPGSKDDIEAHTIGLKGGETGGFLRRGSGGFLLGIVSASSCGLLISLILVALGPAYYLPRKTTIA